jgi:glycosyltransferase involved in cell wall biosynthesis
MHRGRGANRARAAHSHPRRTNDARSLAETLRQLDADRALRRTYAELAYTRARERFTAKRMIDDYLALYRSLLSAKSLAA